MLESEGEVFRRKDMADVSRGISAYHAHHVGKDDQTWHQGHKSEYLRHDEIAGRIDALCTAGFFLLVQSIYLLGHSHGAKFGGNVTADLTGKDKTHDTG